MWVTWFLILFLFLYQIWFNNVPHPKLTEYKKNQNWVRKDGDYFNFPGGGTQFKEGVTHYIEFIQRVRNIGFASIISLSFDWFWDVHNLHLSFSLFLFPLIWLISDFSDHRMGKTHTGSFRCWMRCC